MVSNFRGCPHIIKAYIKLNHRHEEGICFYDQKKYLSDKVPEQRKGSYLRQRFEAFIDWYDEFTGMDEVREAQRRVLEDERGFRIAQEERRKVLNELTEVQNKLKDVLTELDNTGRGDERYVALVTQEHKYIKEEKGILEKFARAEKLEREKFTALSTSVKLSHEKERAQSERTKYWSIIGSVLGTVIGVLGSSINNHFKMNELKQLIKNSTNIHVMDSMTSYLETNEKILKKLECEKSDITEEVKSNFIKIEETLQSFCKRLSVMEAGLKQNSTEVSNMRGEKLSSKVEDSAIVTVPINCVEESLKKEYTQAKKLLFTLIVLSIIMPIISKYST